jgi:nucleotide-binding universal stress UspA family protein
MVKQKLMQVLAILAVFCSSTAIVLAEPASQPDESFNDRFIALGLAAGLLAFAFFRRKTRQSPPAINKVESNEFPSQTGSVPEVAVRTAAAELVAAELVAAAKLTAVKLAAAKLSAEDDSIAAQAISKNVVVPVDFSPNSEFAIRLALVWTKPNDRVKIVYCIDLENVFPPEYLTPSDLIAVHPAFENIGIKTAYHWSKLPWVAVLPLAMEIVERWAANEFARLRHTIPIANREQVEFHVLHGDPVNQIVKLSEAISAKLIVLVAHKQTLTDRFITGSHIDKLLHASRIPVIVVCEPVKPEPGLPQEILITTDYSPESLPVFLVLKDLIEGAKPNITVLTVETAHEHHPKASEVLEGLEMAFRSLGLKLGNVKIEASNVERGILDYVKTHKPQLIAMSSHGRLGFAELIHPSVTKAILHDSGVPILVVHEHSMPTKKTVGNLTDLLRMMTG